MKRRQTTRSPRITSTPSWTPSRGGPGGRRALTGPLLIALVATAALAGCDAGTESAAHAEEPPADSAPSVAMPQPVRMTTVQAVPDVVTMREVGRLEPWRRVTISAEVGGTVQDVALEVGQVVPFNSDGGPSPVCSLDPEPFGIALRRTAAVVAAARADLQLAEIRYRSVGELYAKKLNAEMDFQQARIAVDASRANLDGALAALAEAKRILGKAVVTAPPGYRVTDRLVEPHQVIGPAQPILELMDDRKLRLRFSVPGHLTCDLHRDQEIRFEVKGSAGIRTARIIRIGPDADRASGRFPIEAEVQNRDRTLLPGRIAVALLDRARSDNPLAVVPRGAVHIQLAQKTVAVVAADGVVERRAVQTVSAPQLDPQLIALDGVRPGERVALERVGTLRTGDRVVDPTTGVPQNAPDLTPAPAKADATPRHGGTEPDPAPAPAKQTDDGPA
jgi:membrane fusion protein (multidrug efflux system)